MQGLDTRSKKRAEDRALRIDPFLAPSWARRTVNGESTPSHAANEALWFFMGSHDPHLTRLGNKFPHIIHTCLMRTVHNYIES